MPNKVGLPFSAQFEDMVKGFLLKKKSTIDSTMKCLSMSVKSVNFQSMQIHSMKRSERGKEPKKEPEKIWKYSTLFSKLFISKNP